MDLRKEKWMQQRDKDEGGREIVQRGREDRRWVLHDIGI